MRNNLVDHITSRQCANSYYKSKCDLLKSENSSHDQNLANLHYCLSHLCIIIFLSEFPVFIVLLSVILYIDLNQFQELRRS